MAGNALWPCINSAPSLSRWIVDLDCAHLGLPCRHNCRKSPRSRHYLRLFRSRQPTLELPSPSRARFSLACGSDFSTPRKGEIFVRDAKSSMIRKLKSAGYRLYSRKKNPKTGKRRNLGTFKTKAAAKKHERAVQFFKRH